MGTCSNCGSKGLTLKKLKCLYCGKECCERCAFYMLTMNISDKWACSAECRKKYEEQVLSYPLDNIGTVTGAEFNSNVNEFWYKACMAALNKNNSSWEFWRELQKHGMEYSMRLMNIETRSSNHKHTSDLFDRFLAYAFQVLASNIERAGRPLDAADIYEKKLKMYDKARVLRERDKQVTIKSTNVSLDLNQLLQQVKDGGIVAVYRCPHCGGKLKVDKNVDITKLKICEHCGSEIESMDLADFLKTALS